MPDVVTIGTDPTLTVPEPLAFKLREMFVSPPDAVIVGAPDTAALAIVISLTASAVAVTAISSLPLVSAMAVPTLGEVSVLLVRVCVPDVVTTGTDPTLTLPEPLAFKLREIFVSPPDAVIVGAPDVAALAIVISLTALAVAVMAISSLPFPSLIDVKTFGVSIDGVAKLPVTIVGVLRYVFCCLKCVPSLQTVAIPPEGMATPVPAGVVLPIESEL